MELKQVFGSNVRQHRRAARMTQERLAEAVEVSVETIGKIERGVAAPSFETVERIAAALEVSPLVLFGMAELAVPSGARGKALQRIHAILADMNEDQLERAANMLIAYLGR